MITKDSTKRVHAACHPVDARAGIPNFANRTIFHGDNLDFLRRINSGTVDVIATDPPFNTDKEWKGASGASFQDKWNWQKDVRQDWIEDIREIEELADYIFHVRKTDSSMAAFLCFMAVRLLEMRRILKLTGSIYLHCDQAASHYLKQLMDVIFDRKNFRNEIIWAYKTGGAGKRWFSRKHDNILFYTKSADYTFNLQKIKSYARKVQKPGIVSYGTGFAEFFEDENGLYRYAHMRDVWDIPHLNGTTRERNGYPTQKPTALYEPIIEASSNPGDFVLDPFCGSGTTLFVAEELGRQWIGIDVSEDACKTAQGRFENLSISIVTTASSALGLPLVVSYQSWDQSGSIQPRILYHGDNLEFLQAMESETVDLIATDPPFNTGKKWKGASGASFPDEWKWRDDIEGAWLTEMEKQHDKLAKAIQSAIASNSESMGAFLCFMAPRLIEMCRLLNPTGSIYLHCDPIASHYLKQIMDVIFGRENFRREVVWNQQNTSGFKAAANNWIRDHDVILYYRKSGKTTFNKQFGEYKDITLNMYRKVDENGRKYFDRPDGRREYLDERKGVPMGDVWNDIAVLNGGARESMKYPTQKPMALYERIIKASSNEGSIVLDPFCGSGTTLIVAEKLGRRWIGMDASRDACETAQKRFWDIDEAGRAAPSDLGTEGSPTPERSKAKQTASLDCAIEGVDEGLLNGTGRPFARANNNSRGEDRSGRDGREATARAIEVWESATPAEDTLVVDYLASRGLSIDIPPSIRFHQELKHPSGASYACMVALVTHGIDAAPMGILQTFLAPNGKGTAPVDPAKTILGHCRGGVVRLGEIDNDGVLMVGAGIESCLSAHQAKGYPAWACRSISDMRTIELPQSVHNVTVLADSDNRGKNAARRCAQRWAQQNRRVQIVHPPGGMDFNDLLLGNSPHNNRERKQP